MLYKVPTYDARHYYQREGVSATTSVVEKIVAKTEPLNDVSKVRHYGRKEVLTVKCVQQQRQN